MSDADPPSRPEPLTPRQEIEHAARAFMWLMRLRDPRPAVPFLAMPPAVAVSIAERLDLGPDDRLVDIGCGDGHTLAAMVQGAGCHGIGLDRDPDRIAEARAWAEETGQRLRFVEGDFEDADALDALELDQATAVVLFLYPWAVELLLPSLVERLPEAARVVAYCFADGHLASGTREMVPGFAYPGHTVPLYIWTMDEMRSALDAEPA